jgi:hypothetical protein
MLKEVFRTVPVKYTRPDEYFFAGMYSMVCHPNPYVTGDASIVMTGVLFYRDFARDADFRGWRYHSVTGKLIKEFDLLGAGISAPGFLSTNYVTTSRSGKYWGAEWANARMWPFHYGNIVTVIPGEEVKNPEPFWIIDGPSLDYHRWEYGSNGLPILPGKTFVIDDVVPGGGRWITSIGRGSSVFSLGVYNWQSGKWLYDLPMATEIVYITLEDENRCYVLLQNRVVVLVDYVRGEILGAAKLPPLEVGKPYGGDSGLDVIFDYVRMAWDRIHRRLLIIEATPDDPPGVCTMRVRGFQMVPEPVRITVPIPLKVPRQGRKIPVLVQAMDDMNQGVGYYVVDAQVAGSGSPVGMAVTDNRGAAIIQVACEGSPYYVASPAGDWEDTGSPEATPPHTGLVAVTVSLKVPPTNINDIPVSGVEGTGTAVDRPGPPGSGGAGNQRYLWAWDDKGGDDPQSPHAGAPTSMDGWRDYFCQIAGVEMDQPANDYEAVLKGLAGQGMKVNPAQNEKPTTAWPFNAMSVMIDGGGHPRGRIWLPSLVDKNYDSYYTHEIQVIKDDPTAPPTNETAPNMSYIVDRTKNSKPWDLKTTDGKGKFVEACVTGMHDVSAAWGHVKKSTDPRYNGHAADSVLYKNPDGQTAELFQIVTDTGQTTWAFVERTESQTAWYYPA